MNYTSARTLTVGSKVRLATQQQAFYQTGADIMTVEANASVTIKEIHSLDNMNSETGHRFALYTLEYQRHVRTDDQCDPNGDLVEFLGTHVKERNSNSALQANLTRVGRIIELAMDVGTHSKGTLWQIQEICSTNTSQRVYTIKGKVPSQIKYTVRRVREVKVYKPYIIRKRLTIAEIM